jgi:hypothetical protein
MEKVVGWELKEREKDRHRHRGRKTFFKLVD